VARPAFRNCFSGALRCGPSLVYFSTLLALASLMKRSASSWRRNRNCISSAAACSSLKERYKDHDGYVAAVDCREYRPFLRHVPSRKSCRCRFYGIDVG